MKKINIIKKSDEFSSIIKKRNGVANKYFILNIENNDSNIPKFGITFVKHIGKAVTRNKLKRRTKSIIDNNKNIYQKNHYNTAIPQNTLHLIFYFLFYNHFYLFQLI